MRVNECTIGDYFDVARGASPRPIRKYLTDDPDGINWIMIGDAVEGSKYIYSTRKKILRDGVVKSRMVYPGDFLLTNSMSFGRPYITQTEGCIHDGWLVLTPRNPEETDSEFFYYLFGSPKFKKTFSQKAAGAVVKNLNSRLVRSIRVRVPRDVNEQRRIAEILDKADAIRRKRERILGLVDDFLMSVFQFMFGDPVSNPYGYRQKELAACASFISGMTPSKNRVEYWEGEFPWVSPKDMKVELIGDSMDHVSELAFEETKLKKVPANMPLIVVRGMILAHTVPIALTRREVAINQDIKAINFDREIHPILGFWCLKALRRRILNDVEVAAHGTRRINMSRLGTMPIHVPGDQLQGDFVRIVRTVRQIWAHLEASLSESKTLFSSLSQRGFRGEL